MTAGLSADDEGADFLIRSAGRWMLSNISTNYFGRHGATLSLRFYIPFHFRGHTPRSILMLFFCKWSAGKAPAIQYWPSRRVIL